MPNVRKGMKNLDKKKLGQRFVKVTNWHLQVFGVPSVPSVNAAMHVVQNCSGVRGLHDFPGCSLDSDVYKSWN